VRANLRRRRRLGAGVACRAEEAQQHVLGEGAEALRLAAQQVLGARRSLLAQLQP